MPLSDNEKRLLDEIEQTLRIDDPRLALSLRSARPMRRTRTFVLIAITALIVGAGLLVAGLQLRNIAGTILGVTGYGCTVIAADAALRVVVRTRSGRPTKSAGDAQRR